MKRSVIVLVEDDPMSRLVALDAFERGGFEVVDFSRADEAASYTERMSHGMAALVTDVRMPGDRDGVDLACMVRDRWPDIAVLITSGLFGPDGPDDLPPGLAFLPKPWTARVLLDKLHHMLREGALAV